MSDPNCPPPQCLNEPFTQWVTPPFIRNRMQMGQIASSTPPQLLFPGSSSPRHQDRPRPPRFHRKAGDNDQRGSNVPYRFQPRPRQAGGWQPASSSSTAAVRTKTSMTLAASFAMTVIWLVTFRTATLERTCDDTSPHWACALRLSVAIYHLVQRAVNRLHVEYRSKRKHDSIRQITVVFLQASVAPLAE